MTSSNERLLLASGPLSAAIAAAQRRRNGDIELPGDEPPGDGVELTPAPDDGAMIPPPAEL